MKILALYDGTLQSKTALRYGVKKAKETGGELIVLYVFQSSLFIDYDAGPRAEEIARAEASRHLRDAELLLADVGPGVQHRILSEEGDPEEEALRYAATERPDLLLAAPRYHAMARKAGCPVRIMHGIILVPMDNSDTLCADKGNIIDEALAAGSKVMLLGIVPLHLYSAGEMKELELVRKGTADALKSMKQALKDRGIEVSEAIRDGYPDEEILKAALEFSVSLIMLPAGGKTPSELTKAAIILLDEPERVHMPIQLMRTVEV
jgi:nucleotide-binding universal stress UspA family protein